MLNSLNQRNLYRGPASSKEFNERNKLLRDDIAQTYHLLNENEYNIQKNMDIVLRENFFMSYEIKNLRAEIAKLKSMMEDEQDYISPELSRQIHTQNFYTTENLSNNSEDRKTTILREYGVVMPKSTDTISRFGYTTDSGEVFVPNSLEVHLKEGNDTRLDDYGDVIMEDVLIEDPTPLVDRNKNTFWTRTVAYPTHQAVHEVFAELHIIIPTEGFQNIYSNTLKLSPYPEGSIRLHDIMYKGYNNQWHRLETYPTINNEPQTIDNIHKIIFQFPETEMIELKINFSQPYWFENENLSEFTYGFQDINLEYNNYTEKSCEFTTTISLEGQNTRFRRITEPIPVPAKGTSQDLTEMVEFELYYDQDMATSFTFGSEILADVDTVYVKTILKKEAGNIPVLEEIHIPYLYQRR